MSANADGSASAHLSLRQPVEQQQQAPAAAVSRARQRLLSHKQSLEQLDSLGALNLQDYSSDGGDDRQHEHPQQPRPAITPTAHHQQHQQEQPNGQDTVPKPPASARSSCNSRGSDRSTQTAAAAADQARCIVAQATQNSPLLSILATATAADHDALLLAAGSGDDSAIAEVLGLQDAAASVTDGSGVAAALAPHFHPDDARSADNFTALHHAARSGHAGALRLLLSAGADANALNRGAESPLHLAAYGGHLEASRWLLAGGARVDAGNEFGETPLFFAARRGHVEVVRLLLDNGADAAAENRYGETAADEAEDDALEALLRDAARAPTPAAERHLF